MNPHTCSPWSPWRLVASLGLVAACSGAVRTGPGDSAPADSGLLGNPSDRDGDGVPPPEDCDDTNPAVGPLALEVCNGVDDDCDGLVDDDDTSLHPVGQETFFRDNDQDGYGDPNARVSRCAVADGLAAEAGDCDDLRPSVNPGQPEACGTGLDEDCDGVFGEACGVLGLPSEALGSDALPLLALPDSAVDASNLFVVGFDLDGDGTEDALVGDPNQDGGRGTTGVVHALWGDADPARPADGRLDIALESAQAVRPMNASFLAFRMVALDDATGDGRADLAVTSIEGVWLLEAGRVERGVPAALPDVATHGIPMSAGIPTGLENARDVDDDGLSELLVFEPYVGLHLFWGADLAEETAPSLSDALVVSRAGCLGMGKTGTATGIDLDGDGFAEVAAGCPDEATFYGEVVLFAGETLQANASGSVGVTSDESCLSGRAPGLVPGTYLGRVVSHAGDLNHDGYPDLAVSKGDGDFVIVGGGPNRLASLSACGTDPPDALGHDHRITPVPPSDVVSQAVSLAAVGDVSGDGIGDVLAIAADASDGSGSAHVFVGGEGWDNVEVTPSATITLEAGSRVHQGTGAALDRNSADDLLLPAGPGGAVGVLLLDLPGY